MRVLGINDDVTTCECCGKTGLKCTVVIERESGEVHYGRQCAAKLLMGNKKNASVASIEKLAKSIAYARKWLKVTPKHTAEVVVRSINVWGSPCWVRGEYEVEFDNAVTVNA